MVFGCEMIRYNEAWEVEKLSLWRLYMYKMNAPKTVVNDCPKLGYFCKITKRGSCNVVDDCPTWGYFVIL